MEPTTLMEPTTVMKRSSTSSGCSGSDKSCKKHSDSNAVTVGVAVAIPVGCVLILFAVILWIVYRRNKRESQDDNDPDFQGDTEYLPTNEGREYQLRSVTQEKDDESYLPPNNGRFSRRRDTDPFVLPEDNGSSLRDFARQLKNEEYGPYRLASNTNSRVASQVSLPFEKNEVRISHNVGSTLSPYTSTDFNYTQSDKTPPSESCSSSNPPLEQSPVKSTAGEVTRQYVQDHSGFDVEHSRADTTADRSNSVDMGNVLNQLDSSIRAELQQQSDDDHVIGISPAEEENIQRMKSIYKVYLDRDGTVKQHHIDEPEDKKEEEEDETVEGPSDLHLNAPAESHRVASSIYSAAIPLQSYPEQQYYPVQEQNSQYYPVQDQNSQHFPVQDQNSQHYPVQDQNSQQYMPQRQFPMQYAPHAMPFPQQQQYAHPQTLESIGELPSPAYLPSSSSSHSLTSFRGKYKQAQFQPGVINGTAVNPMDYPEMFYTGNNGSYHSLQNPGQPAAPHQLRQSIVMTDPSQLTGGFKYRPAGSIRSASAANTRSNTMTSHMDPIYQQQQAYNSRVSGLLNEEDVMQPPGVGQILPHSGGSDELRRQIGTSHNYNVS